MRRARMLGVSAGVLLVVAGLAVMAVYRRDMRRAYAQVAAGSALVRTPTATVEYAVGGAGVPVLVIHGSGGGFDQGSLVARAVLDERFRWIAPSRFGYLRSTVPDGATFSEQADAYAALLDSLHVPRVAVVALSHGGPSALLFAVRHPARVSSLVLLSAGVATSREAAQDAANSRGSALTTVFQHDPLYWGVSTFFRRGLMSLLGADRTVSASLTPAQRAVVDEVIDRMNPVERRAAGVVFDNRAELPNERISAIRAPTLILHAIDDGLQMYHNAEFAAAHIPGAELQSFARGGHLLLAVEQKAVRAAAQEFILRHVAAP
jgi:2-hydroxy-6-oxonona-2,4-dienedioate hydrolase